MAVTVTVFLCSNPWLCMCLSLNLNHTLTPTVNHAYTLSMILLDTRGVVLNRSLTQPSGLVFTLTATVRDSGIPPLSAAGVAVVRVATVDDNNMVTVKLDMDFDTFVSHTNTATGDHRCAEAMASALQYAGRIVVHEVVPSSTGGVEVTVYFIDGATSVSPSASVVRALLLARAGEMATIGVCAVRAVVSHYDVRHRGKDWGFSIVITCCFFVPITLEASWASLAVRISHSSWTVAQTILSVSFSQAYIAFFIQARWHKALYTQFHSRPHTR